MARFETGHTYEANGGIDPIMVLKRTAKSIRVTNGACEWMMRIKVDEDGNEFVQDSCYGRKAYDMFTYRAEWER